MAKKTTPKAEAKTKTSKTRKTKDTPVSPESVVEVPNTASAESILEEQIPGSAEGTTGVQPHKQEKAPAVRKTSALDAAAQLLADAGQAMGCQEMIEAMMAKGLWTSPKGKTPHATLYAAILREISTKGGASRFTKTERGKFSRTATA